MSALAVAACLFGALADVLERHVERQRAIRKQRAETGMFLTKGRP